MRGILSKALLALCASGMASTAQAAININFDTLTGAEYDTAGVFVTGDLSFTGSVDDGGGLDSVLLEIWDDGALKFTDTFELAVGSSGSFHFEAFYAGLVGTAAPGIGVYVSDGGNTVISLDPFFLPHYADPGQCRENCGPTGAVPEPATWAMMLMGFGATGFALRKGRRRKTALAQAA